MARRCWCSLPFLLMLGCKDAAKEEPAPVAKAEDPAAVHPEIWPSPKWPFAKDAALEEKVAALLKKMTVEEKVGQVIQGDICCITPEDMKKYHLGSILTGGGSVARQQRARTREGVAQARRRVLRRVGRHQQWRRRHPDDLGHRRHARPQQHRRRRAVPAQRRPRRHAQSEVVRRHRARHRRAGAHHRHRLDLRAHGDRAAGRSLGPRLRGLFRRSETRGLVRRRVREGSAGRSGLAGLPARPARDLLDQALPRRRRHRERPRPGRREGPGNRAARHPQRGLRAGHRSRRADHHDLVLELAGSEAQRPQGPDHRRAQEAHELRRLHRR